MTNPIRHSIIETTGGAFDVVAAGLPWGEAMVHAHLLQFHGMGAFDVYRDGDTREAREARMSAPICNVWD